MVECRHGVSDFANSRQGERNVVLDAKDNGSSQPLG